MCNLLWTTQILEDNSQIYISVYSTTKYECSQYRKKKKKLLNLKLKDKIQGSEISNETKKRHT